jgi:hypothetical protein
MYYCTIVLRRLLTNLAVGIIVRDNKAKEKLEQEVGQETFDKLGIVM